MIPVLLFVFLLGWGSGNLTAAIPADLAIWLGWLWLNPFTPCRWCKGSGRHPLNTKRTFGRCWNPRCQRGTVQRLGSKSLHSAIAALKDYRRKNSK